MEIKKIEILWSPKLDFYFRSTRFFHSLRIWFPEDMGGANSKRRGKPSVSQSSPFIPSISFNGLELSFGQTDLGVYTDKSHHVRISPGLEDIWCNHVREKTEFRIVCCNEGGNNGSSAAIIQFIQNVFVQEYAQFRRFCSLIPNTY